jgi:hypothetical protein
MPFPSTSDARLQPSLFNPVDDFALANAEHVSQSFYGEEIAPNIPQAQVVSAKHVANRFGGTVEFLGDLLDSPFDQLLPHKLKLWIGPAAIVGLALDAVLNNESPAAIFGAARMPLDANDELLKLVTGENLRLGSHLLGFRAPVWETL